MATTQSFPLVHYGKIKLNKDAAKYEVVDHFNKIVLSANISEEDRNYLKIVDCEENVLFFIEKNDDNQFLVRDFRGQCIGDTKLDRQDPTIVETRAFDQKYNLHTTKMPLITKTNEFQITTSSNCKSVVGRINTVRNKAILSVQPELQILNKIHILANSIILLGIYNECW